MPCYNIGLTWTLKPLVGTGYERASPPTLRLRRVCGQPAVGLLLALAAFLLQTMPASGDVPVGVDDRARGSTFTDQRVEADTIGIVVYVREGCTHCAEAEEFLRDLADRHPALKLTFRHVLADVGAISDYRAVLTRHDVEQPGVPTIVIRDSVVVGFQSPTTTGRRFVRLLQTYAPPRPLRARPGIADAGQLPGPSVVVPLFGEVRVDEVGLHLFTVAVGALDGFNPCAMWVLLFLLSLLVRFRNRERILAVGGTFVAVSGLAYYSFMATWLNFFLFIGVVREVQLALGLMALGIGALNVKDFVAPARGPSIGVPESAKPGIYERARRVLTAENLPAALGAAAVLAAMVNVVELACTAGPPALYTHVLSVHELPGWQYYGYLGLYVLVYMIDDDAVLGIAPLTLSRRRLGEKGGRWL